MRQALAVPSRGSFGDTFYFLIGNEKPTDTFVVGKKWLEELVGGSRVPGFTTSRWH